MRCDLANESKRLHSARMLFPCLGILLALCANAAAERPNVIYVFADEHRYQSMSFTETPGVKTPNMAKLARGGVSFKYAISNYPVCSPHRAMLLTGRWPYQTGITDNGILLKQDEFTLGDAFKNAGYRTGYIGKWHLGGTRAEPYGFDLSLIWSRTNTHYGASKFHPAEGGAVQPEGYNATLMTDQALTFLRQKSDDPFFLMLSLNPPHSNFRDAPPEKKALYPDGSLPFRENMSREASESGPFRFGTPIYEGYHAHISAVDEELGRIIATLEEQGLWGNTILVYSSDHGSMHGSHALGGKRQPHEESIRVPFLVYGPGVIPALPEQETLFGTIDVMPTLLGLAGLPVPQTCAGRDFSPLFRGEPAPDPDFQLIMHIAKDNASRGTNHPAPIFRGLRTRRYTYAIGPNGPTHLFDNREDPYQNINLVGRDTSTAIVERLQPILVPALQDAHDPFLEP